MTRTTKSKDLCTLPFEYADTPERRALSLEPDGILCVPVLELCHFSRAKPCVDEHQHPGCIEIIFCQRGSLDFNCNGQKMTLFPDHVIVIQPSQKHHLITNQRGRITYGLFFRINTDQPLLHLPSAESELLVTELCAIPQNPFLGGEQIRILFKRLFTSYDTIPPGVHRTLVLRNAVLALLLQLIEQSKKQESPQPSRVRLQRIIDQIRAEPQQEFTTERIARDAALSESLVNILFKKMTGLPPHAFVIACRLKQALNTLQKTEDSITQIALALHFASSQHFAAHFRRFYGITPTEARKGVRPYRGIDA